MGNAVAYTEGRELLLRAVRPVRSEHVPLTACHGRVLAQDVLAAENVPPFDRSPYDGYAFRAEDTAAAPVTLTVIGEVAAGSVCDHKLKAGEAVKILTGAPIPAGADAVIMFEKTTFTSGTVTIHAPVRSGSNIVRTGEDVRKGAVLAYAGQRIDAGLAGTLASQNITMPLVYARPKVGVLSTGSELCAPGGELRPGAIYDSNGSTIGAVLSGIGCEVLSYGIVPDQTDAIARAMERALAECDALVVTGGVSVGDYDLTPQAMERSGVEILFRGARIKPGMACAYGVRDGKPVCAISGNPASSVTNLQMIARPALLRLCGAEDPLPREITVRLCEPFGKKSPFTRILRGRLDLEDGTVRMHISADQGNVVLSSTIGCNVMAIVPEGSGPLAEGTLLRGILI